MTCVVHHYFPYNSTNVGDKLVAYAIRQTLLHYLGPLEYVPFSANSRFKDSSSTTTGLRGANIDRANAEADLIVVGGSNLLEPCKPSRKKPDRHWGIETELESLQRIKVPTMLVGMGTGSDWGCSIRPYSPRARQEVQWLHRISFASTVRDEMTRDKLSEINVQTQCTGCPVTFLTDREIQPVDTSRPLIVSLPPARILKHWSGQWFMRQTMSYLRWLQSQGISMVTTLHERADLDFAPSWVPEGIPRFYSEDISELIGRYEDSCGVIGFRLHAALLGLGLGKPILPVNVDWRGRAFSQTFSLNGMAMEPGKWGQFSKLKVLTKNLLNGDSTLIELLNVQKQGFLKKHQSFFAQARAKLSGLPHTAHAM